MPTGIHFKCRCGRALRVAKYRAGRVVRCWDCREEIRAPLPDLRGPLFQELRAAAHEVLHPQQLGVRAAVALAAAGALMLGRIGLGLLAVAFLTWAIVRRGHLARIAAHALAAARRHPLTLGCALLLLPLGTLAIESTAVALAQEQGWLRYLVLDVTPRAATRAVMGTHDIWDVVEIDQIPTRQILRIYSKGLAQGFPLSYAIPRSLLRGLAYNPDPGYADVDMVGWLTWVNPIAYLVTRLLFSVGIIAGLLSLVALQARWIHLIGTLEIRHLEALRQPELATGATPPAQAAPTLPSSLNPVPIAT